MVNIQRYSTMMVPRLNVISLAIIFFIKACICLQFPFGIKDGFSIETKDTIDKIIGQAYQSLGINTDKEFEHYSNLQEDQLPIDLQQYSEDIVIRIDISANDELKKYLVTNKKQEKDAIHFRLWSKSVTEGVIDVQINEENLVKLIEKFTTPECELKYDIIIDDLAQKIFETYPKDFKKSSNIKGKFISKDSYEYNSTAQVVEAMQNDVFSELFFREYRPLETINAWLDILQQTFPNLVKLEDIGQTYEHRTYKVVHLSAQDADIPHGEKKTIVITGGVHSREWISVSSVLYTIYSMLELYNENPSKIFSKLDFLFIPVLNPDGYEYTWTHDRLWKKNRQETLLPRCFGIDIDHSYDYHWTYSSDWACGEDYSGEAPFEAIESKIWEDYLNSTNDDHKIYGYIDLHSYSQEILYPYAYSCNQNPRDKENLIELAYGISKSIRLQSGKTYNVLPACQDKDLDLMPDLGSGSALDFMYHNKAYWAYQFKLRDSGSHGFLLPGKYIVPVGKEIFAGIRYFCHFVLNDD